MPDFTQRSNKKELLDRDDIPFKDIEQNMQELNVINTLLGGHAITIAGLKYLVENNPPQTVLHICEIGCGGGDNLRVIKKWCSKKNIAATFTGVDINPHCIDFAKTLPSNNGIQFICSNYKTALLPIQPHIVFASLFCHHFTNEDIVDIFKWSAAKATTGFFINDLHRNPFAYYSIKWLSRFFSKSYMVKNDAPLSVLRGFNKKELITLLKQANTNGNKVVWKWAFRWLVTVQNLKN
jgi:2-polyprenyl-3-methyl-5-hydroxy-6-metoxy-1,4-benzoquinol methylase